MNPTFTRKGRYINDSANIEGKIVIITGSNAGIGLATAHDLAKRKGKVYMACRSEEKGQQAVDDVKKASQNENVFFIQLDLASFDSIRQFSIKFHAVESRLDILINNAGLLSPYSKTVDGFELNMGVNHLGHFLMTNLLLDLLKKAAPSRIIVVASALHQIGTIDKEDFNSEKSFGGSWRAYGNSKLANILFMRKTAKLLEGTGVTVNALCPGAVDTDATKYLNVFMKVFIAPIKKLFYKTPENGAQTQIMLAVEPQLEKVSGKYFVGCVEKETSGCKSTDMELAEWLWNHSSTLTGLTLTMEKPE